MGYYTDQLALVRTAMKQIMNGGQNVSYNGRSMTMADLKTLSDLEDKYTPLAAGEVATDPCKGRGRLTYVTPIS